MSAFSSSYASTQLLQLMEEETRGGAADTSFSKLAIQHISSCMSRMNNSHAFVSRYLTYKPSQFLTFRSAAISTRVLSLAAVDPALLTRLLPRNRALLTSLLSLATANPVLTH